MIGASLHHSEPFLDHSFGPIGGIHSHGWNFMSMPEDYRGQFIAQLHNALSGFTGTDVDEAVR